MSRSSALKVFRRLLDVGIGIYLILIPVVLITGGFKIIVLGMSIKATHLYTLLKILFPLVLLRIIITFEFKNVLLLLGSVFLTLLIVEIGLRAWNPQIAEPGMGQLHQASALLGWELIPGSFGIGILGESYHINTAGFRDIEHTLARQPGVHRIVAIGDSFTFGMGVNLEDTYPKQLERILNRANIPSEVINGGVIGHNMWQHYEMLVRKALAYKPDLIILGLFLDDLASSVPPYSQSDEYQGENPFEVRGMSELMSRLSILNLLRNINGLIEYKYRYRRGYTYMKGIENRKKKWGPANPTNSNYRIMSGNIEKRTYQTFSDVLKRFITKANDAEAKVLVVMIPDSVQLNEPHMQFVNRFVAQICGEIEVPYLDVTPVLEAQEDHRSLYLFPFDAHNSPKGLRLIAKAMADRIISLSLLSSVS